MRRIPALDPDVAVLDVRLQDGNGITACREIRSRHPRTACLMLTSFADDEALLQAIMAGAAGYVLKQIRSSDLVEAVRRVAAGQPARSGRDGPGDGASAEGPRGGRADRPAVSSRSDRSGSVGRGLTNRQIADGCSWPRRRSRTT